MLAESGAVYVGVLTTIIMWFGLIICLSMLKGFIHYGANVAIAEWLLKSTNDQTREKLCRWLGDSNEIAEYLHRIDEKLDKDA